MSIETDPHIVYFGANDPRFPANETSKAQALSDFTPEEKELLRQCNKESFYYRCLPLSVAGMTAVQIAAKKGFITPHPLWGTSLSLCAAAVVGFVIGKVSYKSKCEDKFVNLEKGKLGEFVRKKRGITMERYQSDFGKAQFSEEDLRDDPSSTFYSDSNYHPSTGSLNLDVDKNIQYSGLDDRERPSADRETLQFEENENEPIKKFTTYEELRLKNREDYERSLRSYQPIATRVDLSQPPRQWSNIDSSLPRRYDADSRESESRRKDGDNYDNIQKF